MEDRHWPASDLVIGVISDAHGNGPAFEKALDVLRNEGARQVHFLGDAVGYIPSLSVMDVICTPPVAVYCLRGNHEQMLLQRDYLQSNDEVYQLEVLDSVMTPNHRAQMEAWPVERYRMFGNVGVQFMHGSPIDPLHGYVYPDTDLSQFDTRAEYVFMGNTHRPFMRSLNGVTFVNVGSCGLPRDHGLLGSAVAFNLSRLEVRILRFDIRAETQRAFEQALLPVHAEVRKLMDRSTNFPTGDLR